MFNIDRNLLEMMESKTAEFTPQTMNEDFAIFCGCTGNCGQSCSGGCESGCSGSCGRSCSGSRS